MNQIDEKTIQMIDRKIDQEVEKIKIADWVIAMISAGILWAIYEKRGKAVPPLLAGVLTEDLVYGRRRPSGALAEIDGIDEVLPFSKPQKRLLDASILSAGENMKQISETAKSQIGKLLVDSQISHIHPRELEARLRETFRGIDRDWRKVAVTESASMALNGYLLTQQSGHKVVIQSAADCCDWCREMLHGKIFTVLHEAPPSDDALWETALWPGKNNVSRSRHKNVRGGKERPASQLWVPCCPLHPGCRCRPIAFDQKLHEIGADGYMTIKKVRSNP